MSVNVNVRSPCITDCRSLDNKYTTEHLFVNFLLSILARSSCGSYFLLIAASNSLGRL